MNRISVLWNCEMIRYNKPVVDRVRCLCPDKGFKNLFWIWNFDPTKVKRAVYLYATQPLISVCISIVIHNQLDTNGIFYYNQTNPSTTYMNDFELQHTDTEHFGFPYDLWCYALSYLHQLFLSYRLVNFKNILNTAYLTF